MWECSGWECRRNVGMQEEYGNVRGMQEYRYNVGVYGGHGKVGIWTFIINAGMFFSLMECSSQLNRCIEFKCLKSRHMIIVHKSIKTPFIFNNIKIPYLLLLNLQCKHSLFPFKIQVAFLSRRICTQPDTLKACLSQIIYLSKLTAVSLIGGFAKMID